jgi:uncharacterized membrane protein YgcG
MIEDMRQGRNDIKMEERQLWNYAKPTTTSSEESHCTPFTLPSDGVLTLGLSQTITITEDAIFQPACTGTSDVILTGAGSPTSFTDFRDPFYASTLPECYALAAATVIAYMLVIMLLITPRTFLHEGAVVLGRRGFTNGPSGGDAGIGIGGRPWLQKVAAASVAISLTIATADTFAVAQKQYERGYMDASQLQEQVENGLELKIIRVISDTFLWLAQAQTLIRLFPRQREKIIIKWTAFALITLDVLFSILNNFLFEGNSRPRTFVDAIPALSYLFQLALSLLYCAWVIYYALTKKRFAFYHQQMRNQCLVALLSLVSVLIPVVFFVLDISKPDVAGWGDYVRWVGAAAASVVVWEWVERIEALERNEKKDGVLGREVFDGDEMLEVTPSSDSTWANRFKTRKDDGKGGKGGKGGAGAGGGGESDGGGGTATGSNGISWPGVAGIASRYRPRASQDIESGGVVNETTTGRAGKSQPRPRPPLWPTRPPAAATPVSRTDTASAESTVYAIRYHPLSEATPPARDTGRPLQPAALVDDNLEITNARNGNGDGNEGAEKPVLIERMLEGQATSPETQRTTTWQGLSKANPFRRRFQGPPLEVSAHAVKHREPANVHGTSHRWDVRAKLEDFAVTQADKLREKTRANDSTSDLPVTIIPAPTRKRNLEAALEELGELENAERRENRTSTQPVHAEAESSHQPRSQRLSEPYRPDDLNSRSTHQRGTMSFVTAVQQEREREQEQPGEVVSPIEEDRDRITPISPIISRSSPIQLRSPTSPNFPTSPRRDGLSVMSIPAPPRRPRSDSE